MHDQGGRRKGLYALPSPGREARDRLAEDRELVRVLAADGFAGRRYERFEHVLTEYGIPTLCAWMRTGFVFRKLNGRGWNLHPADDELAELQRDSALREELANMTVALTLPDFRESALLGGEWHPDGGASLKTYFLEKCLNVFPREFRKYRTRRRKLSREELWGQVPDAPPGSGSADPAAIVAGREKALHHLDREVSPRTRAMVALRAWGYSHEEIKEILMEDSARAVEGVLKRWRDSLREDADGS
ncbi:hypothetical protein [Streptomyces sp. HNM0574]|uniref:hypothetical protein n=1 Tax=Streptomyces sp. HNM0574 TaxID=2714954 RepID=UPI00146D8D02|nr:hypothetical protein [Streptomyces sp. HNM0574]NLU67478.1 hypothetical protein [Streptomyces sp. HNM0574]